MALYVTFAKSGNSRYIRKADMNMHKKYSDGLEKYKNTNPNTMTPTDNIYKLYGLALIRTKDEEVGEIRIKKNECNRYNLVIKFLFVGNSNNNCIIAKWVKTCDRE